MGPGLSITIIAVTGILTTGGVLIFRPIAKRLGNLLDAMTTQKLRPASQPELAQIRDLLGGIDSRLNLLEERQDFAEALLTNGERRAVPIQPPRDVH
jgi:predicted PurR-regulated permease PerM